ncbi:type I-E CRISPR-associated protein Cse1/CasA [Deinococcus sp. SL84]|uniref:type I-E CRISPR-associated protein Cse1/CasA n=1 Tax=Deinococcus sp. SL84 TaxID=2994663 RepID=UPI00227287C8|nr:type I-E CRISPR-associated protein Cse1/CasA [Deinococcus sp. SL84]MCY1703556.1 type I-E CRISPR-associated protein Cse1/CasA [Deinococcus sp. SL84]
MADGSRDEVSLRDTLLSPRLYRRIDAGQALHTAALYRLHLAILHRALRGPTNEEQAAEWYLQGFPGQDIEDYLARYADRFDLFGSQPFMQVVGLDPAAIGENFRSHWTRIGIDEGSSSSTSLFSPNKRAKESKSRQPYPWPDSSIPYAALNLLAAQAFSLAGTIQRFTLSGQESPVATAALFLAEGSDLHQTLALNLTSYTPSMQAQDLPVWEQPPLTVEEIGQIYAGKEPRLRRAEGYVSRYTWPSRSVLLLPEDTPDGVRVRTIGFGAGVPLEGAGEGHGSNIDPMVALLPARDDKSDPYPYKLRRDRLLWRDLTALLPGNADTVVEDKKGKAKVKPGRTPEVLNHAMKVMELARAKANPAAPQPVPNQDEAADWDEPIADARAKRPVIPVLVFGQLTDQGKAFAIRQESYTLPETFLEDSDTFYNYVKGALAEATKVGEALRRSVFVLAQELLKKDGSRSPDPADIRKLAEQIPAAPTYWQTLETPFRQYLLNLDGDPEQATYSWNAELRRAALGGWKLAQEAAGMNAVGLRAVQKSQGLLLQALGTLAKEGETSDKNER